MPNVISGSNPDSDINFRVDDNALDQLQSLAGQKVVVSIVWDDSIADALDLGELTDLAVDIDVYLSDGVYFELFGVLCYTSLENDPLAGISAIRSAIATLVDAGLWLEEIASDTEDDLVLVLGAHGNTLLYLNAGAWNLDEWEELPEPD